MKIKNKIVIFLIFIGIIIFGKNIGYATTINSLDYNIQLNDNGSMDIVETWNITLDDDNILKRNITLDENDNVTNVKVENLTNSKNLKKVEKDTNNPLKNEYYESKENDNVFEIGWGIEKEYSIELYQISYTIENAVNVYTDCSELNFGIVDRDNMISIENITGIIKLPNNIENNDNLKYWIHGTDNYEINLQEKNTLMFSMNNIDTKNKVDVRFVTKEKIFENSRLTEKTKKWKSIINQEEGKDDSLESTMKIIAISVIAIFLIVIIVFIVLIKNKKKKLEN